MKLLIIGATGYIGSVVATTLEAAGHTVVPLRRPQDSHGENAADVRLGDLADPGSLVAAVTEDIDAIVHAGGPLGDWNADAEAVHALLDALRPGGRFVYLSGTWVLGASEDDGTMTEEAAPRPIAMVDGREKVEAAVLAGERDGVVVRAGIAHGHGGGIPGMMVDWARSHGIGRYVSTGSDPSWAVVHVADLADLIGLALTEASAGTLLHAVGEPAVPVRTIAEAADVAAGGTGEARPWPLDEAAVELGHAFAEALALHQRVTGSSARALGWSPRRQGILAELRNGSYRPASQAGPKLTFARLTEEALDRLLDDDLFGASQVVGAELPSFFLEEKWLWQIRRDQMREAPDSAPWLVRALLLEPEGAVVGHAGFHGPPDPTGIVEVGYTIAPEWRGGGLGHAALAALVAEAATRSEVDVVQASIRPDNAPSLAVARKAGMTEVDSQVNEVDGVELVFHLPLVEVQASS